jgi:hypothetical protein
MAPNSDIKSNYCYSCNFKLNKCECIKKAKKYHIELAAIQNELNATQNIIIIDDNNNSSNTKLLNCIFISIRSALSLLVLIYLFYNIYQIYLRDSKLSVYFCGYATFEFYCLISFLKQLNMTLNE